MYLVAMETCLDSRSLATAFSAGFTILAFRRHATIYNRFADLFVLYILWLSLRWLVGNAMALDGSSHGLIEGVCSYLHGGTEEKDKNLLSIRWCPRRNSNPVPPNTSPEHFYHASMSGGVNINHTEFQSSTVIHIIIADHKFSTLLLWKPNHSELCTPSILSLVSQRSSLMLSYITNENKVELYRI
jgi:hypothetical protein